MLRQTSPRPYRVMKLIASGVLWSAAIIRSPSFSRSSSSTRMIILPARISPSASSMVASGMLLFPFLRESMLFQEIPGQAVPPALEKPQDIFPDDVGFHVDRIPGAHSPPCRPPQSQRDQGDLEPVR